MKNEEANKKVQETIGLATPQAIREPREGFEERVWNKLQKQQSDTSSWYINWQVAAAAILLIVNFSFFAFNYSNNQEEEWQELAQDFGISTDTYLVDFNETENE